MKMAKVAINQRGATERAIQAKVTKQEDVSVGDNKLNIKLSEMLDPATQRLFQMLPPPKQSGQSLSTALRTSEMSINIIRSSKSPLQSDDEEEEDGLKDHEIKEVSGL